MLEQLVESKSSTEENTRKSGFLLTTFLSVVTILSAAITYSLFAKDFTLADESLEFSALVAPVVEVVKPPLPENKSQPERITAHSPASNEIRRREAFAPVEQSTKPPADVRGQKDVQSWVKGAKLSTDSFTPTTSSNLPQRGETGGEIGDSSRDRLPESDVEPPPLITKPKAEPKTEPAPQKRPPVTGGVMNGKATNLVKPAFPPPAKAVGAKGAVNVQILVDEKGNVTNANAVSGHPLLRAAAEQAARASKFSPTLLTGQPVKVTGVIVYNFTAQ